MKKLGILVIVALFASTARAEIVVEESIEWVIADSERVFVGKVAKVERRGNHEAVTVDVAQTFRGKHEAKATFFVPSRGGAAAEGWRKRDLPMLFCLVKRADITDARGLPDNLQWVVRPGISQHSAAFLGSDENHITMPIITRDFKVLTESKQVIAHVEAYAKSIKPEWKKAKLMMSVPTESPAFKRLWAGSAVRLYVPADAAMESLGRAWCKDKSVETRAQGARVLGSFKNEANIKILKSLLVDDGFLNCSGSKSFGDLIIRREYVYFPARAAAYAALQELQLDLEMPTTELTLKQEVELMQRK
jgi:hypothetical protein